MALDFNHLDLNGSDRRLFVAGDIHGHFTLLEEKLVEVGFDKEQDILISVGDLVDRGPESHLAAEYALKPWFYHVRGNHEIMCLQPTGGTLWHIQNGGAWIAEIEPDLRHRMVTVLNSAPYILEVKTPSGKLVGFVHASYPSDDWADAPSFARDPEAQEALVWDRYMVQAAKMLDGRPEFMIADKLARFNIKNVDHVYMGHTPMKEPLTVGNCTWLDTGAFATGILTVLELK